MKVVYTYRGGSDLSSNTQNQKLPKDSRAAMFGLGAGMSVPSLHHSDYDFPDELIPTGLKMFAAIIEQILLNTQK